MIVVDALRKQFPPTGWWTFRKPPVEAVREVSFTSYPGEVCCLLGPNGAGKTTTLRIIATMLRPTSGRALVCGIDVAEDPRAVRRRIGFLTNSTALYDRLTPHEFVTYCGRLHDVPEGRLERRIGELFEMLDMTAYADRRIGTLSQGMAQKVSIARTLVHDPDVLVLDEATTGLDVVAAQRIIELVRQCREEGRTILFSTHRMEEVHALADRVVVLDRGRVVLNDGYGAVREASVGRSLESYFIDLIDGTRERRKAI